MEMLIMVIILFVVIGGGGYLINIYNSLVQLRHNYDKAWANIDVILKQRRDELPKLIDTCKGYMKHERTLLEKLTQARTSFLNARSSDEKTDAENQISKMLKSLFAVAENYPDLKANQNFLQLQGRISSLEDTLADRRELFNESVNLYNIRIQQFPDVLIANAFHYMPHHLLEIPPEETKDIKINFN